MKGNICIVSETGWAVSNDATLDYHKRKVSDENGERTVGESVFEVKEPYGDLAQNEVVKVAFQAEDGNNFSYECRVTKKMESRSFITILQQIDEYKQILERVLSWQTKV